MVIVDKKTVNIYIFNFTVSLADKLQMSQT